MSAADAARKPAKRRSPRAQSRRVPAKQRCLVVGYDGEEASRRAAAWAASQLAPRGKVVLVYACRALHAPPSPLRSDRERHGIGGALFDELLLEGEDQLLDTLLDTETCDSDPVSALNGAASRHQADGIVVGHQPHSRARRAIGTVTGELLAHATVPVTVVPPAERRD
jgi:nucleotide-binding universal stress UspA family protein